jgi:DNA-binding transcriptional MerR regulator
MQIQTLSKMPRKKKKNKKHIFKDIKTNDLPAIPDKLYFTIGEASKLSLVEPHTLRYWEREFSQIKPSKRRFGRRYYQRKDLLLIRHLRELLYDNGYTLEGARAKLMEENGRSYRAKISVTNEAIKELLKEVLHGLDSVLETVEVEAEA